MHRTDLVHFGVWNSSAMKRKKRKQTNNNDENDSRFVRVFLFFWFHLSFLLESLFVFVPAWTQWLHCFVNWMDVYELRVEDVRVWCIIVIVIFRSSTKQNRDCMYVITDTRIAHDNKYDFEFIMTITDCAICWAQLFAGRRLSNRNRIGFHFPQFIRLSIIKWLNFVRQFDLSARVVVASISNQNQFNW